MRVKIGCMPRPWMNYPFERALEGIARAGFVYTAYLGQNQGKLSYTLDSTSKELSALRKKVEGFGLKAVTAWGSDVLRYGAEGLRRHIEYASELGLEYIIVSSPYIKQRHKAERSIDDEFIDYVEQALPLAESKGIALHVKPHSGDFGDGPGLAALAKRIDHPLFWVSYDPGNIHSYEGRLAHEDIISVAEYVKSICVKDFKGGQKVKKYVSPGDGDVEWSPIWQRLAEEKFDGFALIELLGGETESELDQEAIKTRERLMNWVEAAGGAVID